MKTKSKMENSPAQRDSGISSLAGGTMGLMGVMGKKHISKISPAQRDSGNSVLKNRPLCPYCLLCPLVFKNASPQRHSKMSNLVSRDIVTQKGVKDRIFTILIKNIKGFLWVDGGMSQ